MFAYYEIRKNCFFAVCKSWDETGNLEEFNLKFPHGILIGYGSSFSDLLLARLKIS